ncbi:MAG: T9SS type A sorting domain-containing protein [Bacteroidetes bacterium]|nr:T9SS type A sorting domain-containing protein [Bacteroidota bacterium]
MFVLDPTPMFTSIPEINNATSFSLYPNPSSENQLVNIKLNIKPTEEVRVDITNIQGQILSSALSANQNFSIDTKGLSAGIYLVSVIRKEGKSVKKLVIN